MLSTFHLSFSLSLTTIPPDVRAEAGDGLLLVLSPSKIPCYQPCRFPARDGSRKEKKRKKKKKKKKKEKHWLDHSQVRNERCADTEERERNHFLFPLKPRHFGQTTYPAPARQERRGRALFTGTWRRVGMKGLTPRFASKQNMKEQVAWPIGASDWAAGCKGGSCSCNMK
ncbi:hypothetical protein IWX49DRAFT_45164 [Phyllosticta citricarpa]|uniref:Secreted protein n=1 Tax=Phyllosticta citricarpa TaxID=55181 RepID=A0ABR1MIF1_9PEZI